MRCLVDPIPQKNITYRLVEINMGLVNNINKNNNNNNNNNIIIAVVVVVFVVVINTIIIIIILEASYL